MERFGFDLAPMKIEGGETGFDQYNVASASDPEIHEDIVRLPSGRTMYAHLGIVGIGPDGSASQGYDGDLGSDGWNDERALSPLERRELAEIMIARWQKFGGI